MQQYNFFKEENAEKGIVIPLSVFEFNLDEVKFAGIFKSIKNAILNLIPKKSLKTTHAFDELKPFKRAPEPIIFKIIESQKSAGGRNFKALFKKYQIDDVELSDVVDSEHNKSGEMVNMFPVTNYKEVRDRGFFTVTTKGVAYIMCNKENTSNMAAFGVIGAGVKEILNEKSFNRQETAIVENIKKYPVSLISKCYEEGIFVPFEKINEIILNKQRKILYINFGDKYKKFFNLNDDDLTKVETSLKQYSL